MTGHRSRCVAAIALVLAALTGGACSGASSSSADPEVARVERTDPSGPARIHLAARAADRVGLRTAAVADAPAAADGGPRRTVPYSAILYSPGGDAFVYTSPEPLTFVRAPVTVDRIDGDVAVLAAGPPAGALVVTVGAVELLGVEDGVGED